MSFRLSPKAIVSSGEIPNWLHISSSAVPFPTSGITISTQYFPEVKNSNFPFHLSSTSSLQIFSALWGWYKVIILKSSSGTWFQPPVPVTLKWYSSASILYIEVSSKGQYISVAVSRTPSTPFSFENCLHISLPHSCGMDFMILDFPW